MLKKAFTDERMRQIGAFVSGLAAGFYVDTEGVDDRVDGSGVRYRDGSGVLLTKIPSEASVRKILFCYRPLKSFRHNRSLSRANAHYGHICDGIRADARRTLGTAFCPAAPALVSPGC